MIHRFGDFELDEQRRELSHGGREVVLQPKVFELLAYLVKHQERVVKKDELLSTLWPDTVVADGAVQRAVSLARSALRQGGLRDAIRTHARHGYRFCAEAASANQAESQVPSKALGQRLERARRAFENGDWEVAVAAFTEADETSALDGPDLERWGEAAQCAGHGSEALSPLERAIAAHLSAGDFRGAARGAIQLSNIQFERRQFAIANGWRNRAASFLEGQPESREHGLVCWLNCRFACFEANLERAVEEGQRTFSIGQRLEDPDLEALGLEYGGLARVALGDVDRGVAMQDEAAAAVLSGHVSPWAGSMVYCAVIWTCLNRADWQRATQWTDHFARFCEKGRMLPFPGLCRLHRAEVLAVRGDLHEAEREVTGAQQLLGRCAPYAEGDAYRVLGEIRLARGDLAGSDQAFRKAYELGWDPQPGRALLQVKQGKAEAALRSLERSLQNRDWASLQRRGTLLANLTIVAVAAEQLDRAKQALEELDRNPDLTSTPSLEALALRARAEVAFAEGRHAAAIQLLQEAIRTWQQIGSPLHVAGLRVRLAELFAADNDPETAELELTAAEALFQQINMPEMKESCAKMRRSFDVQLK